MCVFPFRYRVLDGNMENYECCQNYIQCCCFKGGACGEKHCPHCCLCLEAFCCVGPSMSSSRAFIMDMYNLRSDPCDNRLIRFSNCCKFIDLETSFSVLLFLILFFDR